MDLDIDVDELQITSNSRGVITAHLEGVCENDLNTRDVAKCVDIETYIDAIGEDVLKEHIERNYDWFTEKQTFDE